jgi:ubiquinone biosynthesis protein
VTVLNIPLFAFFSVLTVLVLAAELRRLMGMRLSPLRTLIALFSASPIITAMAGLHGSPALAAEVSLYSFLGYCLLVTAAILAVRVLVQVFRPSSE